MQLNIIVNLRELSIQLADTIVTFIGSWKFIIVQSIFLAVWIIVNVDHLANFDPYPFILMNLFLSFQAAYATPLILMSSNRQAERDRQHMAQEHEISAEDHIIIKDLKKILDKLQEDMVLSRQSLENHRRLKSDHEDLKDMLLSIHEEVKKRN
jgi:uncharacterized membrane protein